MRPKSSSSTLISRRSIVRMVPSVTSISYDSPGAALSFGQDPRWRRAMVARVMARPTDRVLDVATGTGLVATALVRRYGCSVVGLDQSREMLARADARLAADPELAERVELVPGEA